MAGAIMAGAMEKGRNIRTYEKATALQCPAGKATPYCPDVSTTGNRSTR